MTELEFLRIENARLRGEVERLWNGWRRTLREEVGVAVDQVDAWMSESAGVTDAAGSVTA